jgi:hypothetical protein
MRPLWRVTHVPCFVVGQRVDVGEDARAVEGVVGEDDEAAHLRNTAAVTEDVPE